MRIIRFGFEIDDMVCRLLKKQSGSPLLTCFIEYSAEQPQVERITGQREDVSVSHGSPLQHSASLETQIQSSPELECIARSVRTEPLFLLAMFFLYF
jgi:hypothetical protein